MFFAGSDGTPTSPGHVGLVIGNGKIIEAYATGFPIRVASYAGRGAIGFTQSWAQAGANPASPAASTAPSAPGCCWSATRDILPSQGDGCWPEVPFASGDLPYLRGVETGLNQVLARTATANGATFVDTYTATTGHDACQSPEVKDVEGLIPTSLAYPFHPNRRGELVMADQVLAALRS